MPSHITCGLPVTRLERIPTTLPDLSVSDRRFFSNSRITPGGHRRSSVPALLSLYPVETTIRHSAHSVLRVTLLRSWLPTNCRDADQLCSYCNTSARTIVEVWYSDAH